MPALYLSSSFALKLLLGKCCGHHLNIFIIPCYHSSDALVVCQLHFIDFGGICNALIFLGADIYIWQEDLPSSCGAIFFFEKKKKKKNNPRPPPQKFFFFPPFFFFFYLKNFPPPHSFFFFSVTSLWSIPEAAVIQTAHHPRQLTALFPELSWWLPGPGRLFVSVSKNPDVDVPYPPLFVWRWTIKGETFVIQ